jgi:hypothetical protein
VYSNWLHPKRLQGFKVSKIEGFKVSRFQSKNQYPAPYPAAGALAFALNLETSETWKL